MRSIKSLASRERVLKKLRELYIRKDFDGLKRSFLLSAFALTQDDRDKILSVLKSHSKELDPLIAHAIKELGGELEKG